MKNSIVFRYDLCNECQSKLYDIVTKVFSFHFFIIDIDII